MHRLDIKSESVSDSTVKGAADFIAATDKHPSFFSERKGELDKFKQETASEFNATRMSGSYIYNNLGCYIKTGARDSISFNHQKFPFDIHRIATSGAFEFFLSPQGKVYYQNDRDFFEEIKDLPKISDMWIYGKHLYLLCEDKIIIVNTFDLYDSYGKRYPNNFEIIHLPAITQIAPSDLSAFLLSRDGNIFQFNINPYSTNFTKSKPPIEIKGDGTVPKFKEIAASYSHCLALSVDGNVYVREMNHNCIPGYRDVKAQGNFLKIEGLPKIKAIAAYENASAFVDENNRLFVCGQAEIYSPTISAPKYILTLPANITQISFQTLNDINRFALVLLGERDKNLYFYQWCRKGTKVYEERLPFLSPSERMDVEGKIKNVFLDDENWVQFTDIMFFIKRLAKAKRTEERVKILDDICNLIKNKLGTDATMDIEVTKTLVNLTEKLLDAFPQYHGSLEERLAIAKSKSSVERRPG